MNLAYNFIFWQPTCSIIFSFFSLFVIKTLAQLWTLLRWKGKKQLTLSLYIIENILDMFTAFDTITSVIKSEHS